LTAANLGQLRRLGQALLTATNLVQTLYLGLARLTNYLGQSLQQGMAPLSDANL
jgi:hypothetical protein